MEDDQMELQLLPTPHTRTSQSLALSSSWSSDSRSFQSNHTQYHSNNGGPSLDLQLSNTFKPIRPSLENYKLGGGRRPTNAIKWQRGDQIRIGTMEKAYVERVREMTQREMELAQSELSCARHMWERAQEEVERAEKMKKDATRWIDSTCMEITCQACRQPFRP